MVTINQVIDYVDERKLGSNLESWTRDQIGSYVWENIQVGTINVALSNNNEILGVGIFNPNLRGEFWVNQLFGGGQEMWRLFIKKLDESFPHVTELWAIRRNNSFVKFKVSTIKKLYGRRSSSTTSSRINSKDTCCV